MKNIRLLAIILSVIVFIFSANNFCARLEPRSNIPYIKQKIDINHNEEKTTLDNEILNGRIRVIKDEYVITGNRHHIIDNSGRYNTIRKDSVVYFFNELGSLITHTRFGDKRTYKYNTNNQLIKSNRYSLRYRFIIDRNKFRYDKNGNLIKKNTKSPVLILNNITLFYYNDFVIHYTYNSNGNLIEDKRFNKLIIFRELWIHYKYQYDSLGNRIIEEELDRNKKGRVVVRKENKYLDDKLVETFTWKEFESEDLYLRDIYEYNEDGTLNVHTKIVYEYGSTEKESNKTINNYSYEYDSNGRLIEETKTVLYIQDNRETPREKTIWQYSDFDVYGNWGKRTFNYINYIDSETRQRLVERKIEYY